MKTLDQFLKTKGITKEVFDGMEADKQAEIYNELNTENAVAFEAIVKSAESSKDEIAKIKEELADGIKAQNKDLNTKLSEMGLEIKRLKDVADGDISLTTTDSLDSQLKDNADALKVLAETGQGKVTLKVAGDMTIIGNISGGNVPVEQREAGVNQIARRRTFIRELVNNGVATSNLISWVEQTSVDGSVAGTVEGVLKNQIDFDLVVANEAVKKRTAFIKASTEMLGDIDFMRSEINNELSVRMALDIDDQILNGDNVGQNLNGIITQATAYSAGVFAATVTDPNLVDVLTTAVDQIVLANHFPTVHVLHHSDLTTLRLIKAGAADGEYVSRIQEVAGTMVLDGIPVVANNGIAQGEFLTMDGTKDTVFSRGEATIQIGLDSDDFTKNFRTILIEWRGLNRIKGNDTTAFVTGNIAAAIAAL